MPSLAERLTAFERNPPPELLADPIWRLPAYRIALFLSDVVRTDGTTLIRSRRSPHVLLQLERSVDSIGANLSEGYSRFSGRERARYYEMALGSAREAREWYRRCANVLGEDPARERCLLLARVVAILNVAIPREREGASEDRIRRARLQRRRPENAPEPDATDGATPES